MNDDNLCSAMDLRNLKEACLQNNRASCFSCFFVQLNAGYSKPDCKKLGLKLILSNIPKQCPFYLNEDIERRKRNREEKLQRIQKEINSLNDADRKKLRF